MKIIIIIMVVIVVIIIKLFEILVFHRNYLELQIFYNCFNQNSYIIYQQKIIFRIFSRFFFRYTIYKYL